MKEHPFTKEKIAQFFEGTLPETQHTAVLNWFSSLSKEDQLTFMDAHLAAMEEQGAGLSVSAATGFDQIEERILSKKRSHQKAGYWLLRVAAVTFPFLLGYLLIQPPASQPKASSAITIAAANKTIQVNNELTTVKDIDLPDSSMVSLYPGATLSYAAGLQGKKRELQLSGKAFFKVKHDAHRPFTVQTGAITTVVLGTSFWIDAAKGAKNISVKVKTGKVGVVYGMQPAIFLLPTEMAVFNTLSGVLAKVKKPVREKQVLVNLNSIPTALVFNETPLKQVVKALAENFRINIVMQDSLETDLPISLITKGKTMADILQEIKSQIHIDYEIKDNKITIKKQE